jgi:hypothetical protein
VLRFSSATNREPWRARATPKFESFPLEGCLERVAAPVWPSGGVLGPNSAPRCVRQKLVPFRSCECVCVLNCNSAFACGFAFLTSVVLFPILVVLPCGVRKHGVYFGHRVARCARYSAVGSDFWFEDSRLRISHSRLRVTPVRLRSGPRAPGSLIPSYVAP